MFVKRTVSEWKGIEYLPVVHQLVEEKLSAEGGWHQLDPDVVDVKSLYQRWCHREDINPRQQSMLQSLCDCLDRLEIKRSMLA